MAVLQHGDHDWLLAPILPPSVRETRVLCALIVHGPPPSRSQPAAGSPERTCGLEFRRGQRDRRKLPLLRKCLCRFFHWPVGSLDLEGW